MNVIILCIAKTLVLRYAGRSAYRQQKALCYQSEQATKVFLLLSGRIRRLKYRADDSCLVLAKSFSMLHA